MKYQTKQQAKISEILSIIFVILMVLASIKAYDVFYVQPQMDEQRIHIDIIEQELFLKQEQQDFQELECTEDEPYKIYRIDITCIDSSSIGFPYNSYDECIKDSKDYKKLNDMIKEHGWTCDIEKIYPCESFCWNKRVDEEPTKDVLDIQEEKISFLRNDESVMHIQIDNIDSILEIKRAIFERAVRIQEDNPNVIILVTGCNTELECETCRVAGTRGCEWQ